MQIHQRGGNLQGEEAGKGKLHSMWSDSDVVIPAWTHSEATSQDSAADEGGVDKGEGGTNYLCGFLPMGAQDGDMPGDGLSRSSAYRGPDERTFQL